MKKNIITKSCLLLFIFTVWTCQVEAQSFTFETDNDTEGFTGRSGGAVVSQKVVESRGVIEWEHMNNGQPSLESTLTIDAQTNKFITIVFQNNSNATQIRLKNDTGAPWVGSVNNIMANSTDWQTLTLDASTLDSFDTDGASYTLVYQFREGNTALNGAIYIDEITFHENPSLSLNNQVKDANTISLYPNPAENILNIKSTGAESISKVDIYNLIGQQVYSVKGGAAFSVSQLNKGIYMAKVYTDNKQVVVKRFVKK
ncbi:T9SS type A sorting domain-containing protein [Pseudotamlana carrageenivorans]|uniref:Secretion system C-terminal sorting domain-containing protein n=1 Tax=Pseudotamlana carrageenivorans TaxID=2069432 RepID=A0A2I7SHX0_9FLAO|nr:T9SS type A sorting domain-containing protein [Tamlana carrageenivorans]AUS05501.1 hypothetical protein C1A40_08490 [Tamlana carrageenivorans]